MRSPPVLLEHVSLVRRMLAESEHSDVASVGRLYAFAYRKVGLFFQFFTFSSSPGLPVGAVVRLVRLNMAVPPARRMISLH